MLSRLVALLLCKMKSCLLLLLALFTAQSHALEDIIVNGGFTSGALPPWTSTGNVTVSAVVPAARMEGDASIQQVIPTKAGGRYYLAFRADNLTTNLLPAGIEVKATPAAGGNNNLAFSLTVSAGLPARAGRFFTATSASTRLTVSITDPAEIVVVDNFVLFEIVVPSPFAGVYNGTATSELKGPLGARTRTIAIASAEVSDDGQILILEGSTRAHAGVVFDDGSSIIRYFGNGADLTETGAGGVLLTGKTLTLSYGQPFDEARNEAGEGANVAFEAKFKLRRKGK